MDQTDVGSEHFLLEGLSHAVTIGGVTSDPAPVLSGVLQGTVLAPPVILVLY